MISLQLLNLNINYWLFKFSAIALCSCHSNSKKLLRSRGGCSKSDKKGMRFGRSFRWVPVGVSPRNLVDMQFFCSSMESSRALFWGLVEKKWLFVPLFFLVSDENIFAGYGGAKIGSPRVSMRVNVRSARLQLCYEPSPSLCPPSKIALLGRRLDRIFLNL